MRLLAIDFGTKKCGVAISDPLKIISQPLKTIFYENIDFLFNEIKKVVDEYKPIEKIILGLTKNIDGSLSNVGKLTMKFKSKLEEFFTQIQIVLVDEKYTTKESKKIMQEMNLKKKNKKEKKDAIAAQKILERFLNNNI